MSGDLILRLIRWGLRKIGTRTLVAWMLLVTLLACLASGLSPILRDVEVSMLLPIIGTALLTGWICAYPGVSVPAGIGLGSFTGLGFILLQVGQQQSAWLDLLQAANRLALRVLTWHPGLPYPDFDPTIHSGESLLQNSRVILLRGWEWAAGFTGDSPSYDSIGGLLFWSLLVWLVAFWASWSLRRFAAPLLAALPSGLLLGTSMSAARSSESILLLFLSATLLLMGWVAAERRQANWEQRQIDYSEDLNVDIGISLVLLVLGVTLLAVLAPMVSIQGMQDFIASLHMQQETINRSLGLETAPQPAIEKPSPARPVPADQNRDAFQRLKMGGMPREHLVGSGPELSETIVMRVRTGDLPSMPGEMAAGRPAPRYYWRSLAYDIYTGAGWSAGSTLEHSYEADEPFFEDHPPAQHSLIQAITRTTASDGLLFAAGEVRQVDRPVLAFWRRYPGDQGWSEMDLFGAAVQAADYQVRSLLPQPSLVQLKTAGSRYPDWVRSRYLQLPQTVPSRVRSLARQLTAGQPDPYQRALAIQNYLRRFPYTLDTSLPPRGADVADYFLFELREGYCDYYATAMVVLARSSGIPARLAVGYAGGTYDYQSAVYLVSEDQAHSWPEVYFPGYGWVAFEPTGGLPAIQWMDGAASTAPDDVRQVSWKPDWTRFIPWRKMLIVAGVLLLGPALLFLAWIASEPWRLATLDPQHAILSLYRRLYLFGVELGIPAEPGSTPAEVGAAFQRYLRETTSGGKASRLLQAGDREVRELSEIYAAAVYSPRAARPADKQRALHLWNHLHWRLRLARLLSLLRSVRTNPPERLH